VLEAERAIAQAQAYGKVGHDQRAKEIVERALTEVRAIPYPRTEAELLLLDSESKLQLSDKSGALDASRAAHRAAIRAGDDALAVRAATSIVYVQSVWFHDTQEAEQWAELADATADRAGHTDVTDAELLLARASINANDGHPEGNVEILEKLISILKRLYGDRDPRVAKAVMDYGISLALLGRYEPAVKYIQEGVDLMAATGGAHNPRLALYYLNLAGAFDPLSRWEEAKRAHEHGLELLADRPPGPLNVVFLGQLATVEKELGHLDSAFDYAERALEVARAIGEKGKFEWLARYAHATARGQKGDWAAQATECAEILGLQRTAGQASAKVPFWPDSLACIAEAELAMGKVGLALQHLEETVKLESRTDVEALPRAKFELAKALRVAKRDAPRARQLAESARDDMRKVAGREQEVAKIDQWLVEPESSASPR
jgi:tetratricopeptide (TPR) repeat protein